MKSDPGHHTTLHSLKLHSSTQHQSQAGRRFDKHNCGLNKPGGVYTLYLIIKKSQISAFGTVNCLQFLPPPLLSLNVRHNIYEIKTQTCKQEYVSARHIVEPCRGLKKRENIAKRNMSSAVCALSIYSHLCIKMSSFLFVCAWAMPRILYLSCGIPFPV